MWRRAVLAARFPGMSFKEPFGQKRRSVVAWAGQPTMVVGRRPTWPHRLQVSLVASHMSSCPCFTCLVFGYVGLMLHVGPLIHVSLIPVL